MSPAGVTRLRRAFLVLSALAATWAAVVTFTGGFIVYLHDLQVSSRNPRTPILIAVLSACAACALPMPGGWRRTVRDARRRWSNRIGWLRKRTPWPRWADPAAMIALVTVGILTYQWNSARPLWLDEEMIALNVRDRSFAELAGSLWLGQSAPLGWLALQRTAVLTLGTGEHALRLVPVLFGIATVLAAVWVGRRWMGPVGAVVLVLLCSFGRWLTHYPLEVKHYSADVFWGLALPALAAWTMEADGSEQRTRRAAVWWTAAAVGQFLANGALLVTPACAVVLLLMLWRRAGWRAALVFALIGTAWLASFGLHFFVAIRHTLSNDFLRSYWSSGLPPPSAGLIDTLSWLASQFQPLAVNPGGTELWPVFWLLAASGLLLSSRPLGVIFATVVVSAFAFAALGLVPLQDRLALWALPGLYLGVALFVDRTVRFAREAFVGRGWLRLALSLIVALVAVQLCADIFRRGKHDIQIGRSPDSKQGFNDRDGVQWLMAQRQPGDAFVTTHLALPAVWWYGGFRLSGLDSHSPGSRHPDGGRIFEVGYGHPASDCQRDQLRDVLGDQRRLLVYIGFPDIPKRFDELLLASLGRLGVLRARRRFGDIGHAALIDLRAAPGTERALPIGLRAESGAPVVPLDGCVTARVASRW